MPNLPMFECEFRCECGGLIGLKIALAIVQSQTGAEVTCHRKDCDRRWKVTEKGAQEIRDVQLGNKPQRNARLVHGSGIQLQPIDAATEADAIRRAQSRIERKQRSAGSPVWSMRLRHVQSDTKGMGGSTDCPG